MKSKILFCEAIFLLILFNSGWAADILGNWIAKIPASRRTDKIALKQIDETVFSFNTDGTKLTGTVSYGESKIAISKGVIRGDKISFTVIGDAAENGVSFEYRGEVGLNEIQFTRRRLKGSAQRPEKFVAKREFLRHNDYIPSGAFAPMPPLP